MYRESSAQTNSSTQSSKFEGSKLGNLDSATKSLIVFAAQANLDSLSNPFHQRVQSFRLRVATPESGHNRNVVTFFVTFDDYR